MRTWHTPTRTAQANNPKNAQPDVDAGAHTWRLAVPVPVVIFAATAVIFTLVLALSLPPGTVPREFGHRGIHACTAATQRGARAKRPGPRCGVLAGASTDDGDAEVVLAATERILGHGTSPFAAHRHGPDGGGAVGVRRGVLRAVQVKVGAELLPAVGEGSGGQVGVARSYRCARKYGRGGQTDLGHGAWWVVPLATRWESPHIAMSTMFIPNYKIYE